MIKYKKRFLILSAWHRKKCKFQGNYNRLLYYLDRELSKIYKNSKIIKNWIFRLSKEENYRSKCVLKKNSRIMKVNGSMTKIFHNIANVDYLLMDKWLCAKIYFASVNGFTLTVLIRQLTNKKHGIVDIVVN